MSTAQQVRQAYKNWNRMGAEGRNRVRVLQGGRLMELYLRDQGKAYGEEDVLDQLVDALSDLRHWANARGADFSQAVYRSEMHFRAEALEAKSKNGGPKNA